MNEDKWFYLLADREHGPCTDQELLWKIKCGELPADVSIRRGDSNEYFAAKQLMAAVPAETPAPAGNDTDLPSGFRVRDTKAAEGMSDRIVRYSMRAMVALVLLVLCGGLAGWFWGIHLPAKHEEEAAKQKERDELAARRVADEAHAKARAEELARKEVERIAAEEAASFTKAELLTEIGASWTNSLRMKFVPIVGSKSLFCAHETRVQDYARFIESTKRDWFKPPFEQEPVHPVVNVMWDEAMAFCRWLTARERATGQLGPRDEYSLPSDLAWSAAAGLLKEPGSTPSERNMRVPQVYAWGTNWPPARASGNFGRVLSTDEFEFTAPVCSFPPNKFGIHDLAGNAAEWCLDQFGDDPAARVVRGGSFEDYVPANLHAAFRGSKPRSRRMKDVGFRIVLQLAR